MKINKKMEGNGKEVQSIHIEFSHPTAEVVAIAGTFPSVRRPRVFTRGRWGRVPDPSHRNNDL
jgi:hypothetical protein